MSHPRGQALTEMALGLLVFVTVLLFGIAFGEWGYLSLKVHEAATASLWDTTALQLHKHPTDYSPRDRAIDQAGPRASRLYSGFDGREGRRLAPAGAQTLTFGEQLEVECRSDPLLETSAARMPPFPGGEGGMQCSSRAWLAMRLDMFPTRFVDGAGGFFKARHLSRTRIPVCGLGRAQNGKCSRGSYALLLDTWGLAGKKEVKDCSLDRCDNQPYRKLVEELYEEAMQGAGPESARAFARAVVGQAPGPSTRTFHFSFVSKKGDPGFTKGDADPADWMTNVRTGSRNIRYEDRGNHFLGMRRPR